MTSGPHLRLVLPHQLFEAHLEVDRGTVLVLIEHDLLLRQYPFHSHKLVLHRASTARFASRAREGGHDVVVLASEADRSSNDQLTALVRDRAPSRITWFDVVDDWLERDLRAAVAAGGYEPTEDDELETPNFLTPRAHVDSWFGNHAARMHDFYVWQRRRLEILLTDDGGPVGGQWSFDADNRKKLPRGYDPRRWRGSPATPSSPATTSWTSRARAASPSTATTP
ncbi:cryptochrome/photolyase family protein [Litorihabitans aurantiacus]|uniref:Cryptochrome/photolyase family protein n=1 Tax=Litorihabitans aurantiacus TaxID=1930061 RepID=A0AA37UK55_9MICO|nr:cryptochrome/photolyase family protein [Litorihabitans aurantiacus]GMA30565.1 hypothetical protein GCM10025875_05570 [Litorihabitans aurantiacus]